MSEENLTEGYSILEETCMLVCEPPYHNLDTLLEDLSNTLWWNIQNKKPPRKVVFKWAVSIKPCPSRDSTRIAKTDVLTVQR